MEPGVWEALRQQRLEYRRQRRPRCVCCGEHIGSEEYLDLTNFGLRGFACGRCVEANTGDTEELDE